MSFKDFNSSCILIFFMSFKEFNSSCISLPIPIVSFPIVSDRYRRGYKLAVPKWEKMEQDLLDRGIQPATMNWPERSRTWFYGHGESLDPVTGACIYGPKIQLAAQRLQEAIQAVAEGIFQPDRERDTPMEIQNIRATQEAKAWFRGSMGSGITLIHIEVGKEEKMMSRSTCEG